MFNHKIDLSTGFVYSHRGTLAEGGNGGTVVSNGTIVVSMFVLHSFLQSVISQPLLTTLQFTSMDNI